MMSKIFQLCKNNWRPTWISKSITLLSWRKWTNLPPPLPPNPRFSIIKRKKACNGCIYFIISLVHKVHISWLYIFNYCRTNLALRKLEASEKQHSSCSPIISNRPILNRAGKETPFSQKNSFLTMISLFYLFRKTYC